MKNSKAGIKCKNTSINIIMLLSMFASVLILTVQNVRAENQNDPYLVAPDTSLDHHIRHGLYLSISQGFDAEVSGKHLAYTPTPPFYSAQTPFHSAQKATSNADVSGIKSVGYNIRYIPDMDLGLGVEFGVYYSNTHVPRQVASLKGSNGETLQTLVGFDPNTGAPILDPLNVDSPSSYMQTADFYMGAFYSFPELSFLNSSALDIGFTPYVGAGYTRVLGRWNRSFYDAATHPQDYGKKDSTAVNGYYVSGKIGAQVFKHFSIEGEYAVYDLHADAFRSLNINGADIHYDRFSLSIIFNF